MNWNARKRCARRAQKRLDAVHAGRRAHPVLEGLSLPEDASGRAARLIVLGGERALVENCRGIEEVGERRVRLRLDGGLLTVEGEGLHLRDVREDGACVCGRLHALRFPGAPEADE